MDKISALMDSELDEDDVARLFSRLKPQDELRESWDTFHLIGDALRGDCRLSPHFSLRVAERLAAEPTVLAPRRRNAAKRVNTYVLSAAASLSAVALVVWVAFSINPSAPPQEIAKAQIPAAAPVAAIAQVPATAQVAGIANVSSEGDMHEYLLAHQGFSPSTAIQGVLPYIRSVSDTRPLPNR
jgi:sigma-E factor negative regulatory protein RseA